MCTLTDKLEQLALLYPFVSDTLIKAIEEIERCRRELGTSRYAFNELKNNWLSFMTALQGIEKERELNRYG